MYAGNWRSRHDPLHTQREFQPPQRLAPQPPIAAFGGEGGIGRGLALAPNAQDAGVDEIDTAAAIEGIEAFDHVVRLARALEAAGPGPPQPQDCPCP